MSVSPETDPDGVDRDDRSAELHENVRHGEEGVESPGTEPDTATGLIGNGQMTDPRYLAQR